MRQLIAAGLATLALNACQHSGTTSPAVLSDGSAETLAKLETTLATAMGVASIKLGAGDPTEISTISVLPPTLNPNEDRSTALPVLFDLIVEGEACYAVQQNSDQRITLDDISCRPA